jgi:hypothetical protein
MIPMNVQVKQQSRNVVIFQLFVFISHYLKQDCHSNVIHIDMSCISISI